MGFQQLDDLYDLDKAISAFEGAVSRATLPWMNQVGALE